MPIPPFLGSTPGGSCTHKFSGLNGASLLFLYQGIWYRQQPGGTLCFRALVIESGEHADHHPGTGKA